MFLTQRHGILRMLLRKIDPAARSIDIGSKCQSKRLTKGMCKLLCQVPSFIDFRQRLIGIPRNPEYRRQIGKTRYTRVLQRADAMLTREIESQCRLQMITRWRKFSEMRQNLPQCPMSVQQTPGIPLPLDHLQALLPDLPCQLKIAADDVE